MIHILVSEWSLNDYVDYMYKFRIHTVCKGQKTDCKHKKGIMYKLYKKIRSSHYASYCLLTPAADDNR